MTDTRSLSDAIQAHVRERAMAALDAGVPPQTIAVVLGLHVNTVYRWTSLRRQRGPAALESRPRGRPLGVGRLLSPEQEDDLRALVADSMPSEHGIASPTWNRRAVAELAANRYGVELAPRTVGDYLDRWGYGYKSAEKHDWQQCPEAVAEWLGAGFPAIQELAAKEDAALLFLDETGVCSNPTPARGYAPVGKAPKVEMGNVRSRVNVSSAIGADGTLAHFIYTENTTGAVFVGVLEELVKQVGRKLHLVVDRHPAHTAKVVTEWVAENAGRIALHFLPAHAPEMNPAEYLNHDIKANVFREGYPKSKADLMGKTSRFMAGLAATEKVGARYFMHEEAKYAAG